MQRLTHYYLHQFSVLLILLTLILVSSVVESSTYNLNLTTPPLEMQSRLIPDWKIKQDTIVKAPIVNGPQDWSKLQFEEKSGLLSQFDFNEPVSTTHWVLFWTLQALDVYTTYKGLHCDGVRELNPLFPDEPKLGQIILTKAILLSPLMYMNDNYEFNNKHIIGVTGVGALTVLNNRQTIRTKCN
jgi:hypothetical protein